LLLQKFLQSSHLTSRNKRKKKKIYAKNKLAMGKKKQEEKKVSEWDLCSQGPLA